MGERKEKPVLFNSGEVVMTALVAAWEVDARPFLDRHFRGDWGDVCKEDAALNDAAVTNGSRILSSYPLDTLAEESRVWIITEADRSRTTVLFPSEY
jgi:hypothetical protein